MPVYFRKLLRYCTAALCVLTAASGAFLFLALRTEYDIALRHFVQDASLPLIPAILCILGCALTIVPAITAAAKKIEVIPAQNASAAVFSATLLGFLLFASFIMDIRALADAGLSWFARILPALGGLSAFYFLAIATRKETASPSAIPALLSLIPILYAFLSVMNTYFDTSYAMNAPVKSYELMTYLSMALFFTAEARLTLGRQKTSVYCLFTGLCLVMCGTVGIAELILALLSPSYGFTLMESAVSLVCAIFAAVRLFSLDEIPPAPLKTEETSDKSEEASDEANG